MRYTVKASDRAQGGIAGWRFREIHAFRRGIQCSRASPFVEIAGEDQRRFLAACDMLHDGLYLLETITTDQPEMQAHNAQAPNLRFKLRQDCATWLQPRKLQVLRVDNAQRRACKHRIAVPPERSSGRTEGQNLPTIAFQEVTGQGGRTRRQAFVHLLQHHQIGAKRIDHLQTSIRTPAHVETDAFLQVIGCNSQVRIIHANTIAIQAED